MRRAVFTGARGERVVDAYCIGSLEITCGGFFCWCVGCFVCFVSVYGFCGLGSEFICNRRSCWPSEHAHNLIGLHWAGREISVWKRTAKYDYLNIVENNACRTQWIDCVDAVLLVQSCMNTKLNMIRRRLLLTKCIFIKTYA